MTFRGAIISVGGSEQPIIKSLLQHSPEAVLFFVSADSRKEVEAKILPVLGQTPQYSFVETPNPGDLAVCYEVLRRRIPEWLSDRDLQPEQVCVDITGATKPMSAGLAMAGAEHFSHFSYVTGKERDKEGLGIVISGTEYVLFASNPWDKLATRERDKATWLFKTAQPEEAARLLLDAANKCSPNLKEELRALGDLVTVFARTDRFQFKGLPHNYNKIRGELKQIFARRAQPEALAKIEEIAEHWRRLEGEADPDSGSVIATLQELLANAGRRAGQGRYDDAIARLYRAAELFVQGKLYEAFQCRLGKLRFDQVAAGMQAAFRAEFGVADEHNLGLEQGFRALGYSPRPEDREIPRRYEAIKGHLQKRNDSILAHGLRPASEEDFRGFWEALLPVVEVKEEVIPRWPGLEF